MHARAPRTGTSGKVGGEGWRVAGWECGRVCAIEVGRDR